MVATAFRRRSKAMRSKDKPFPDDKTASERRKGLTKEELKELELAGGVEGGMEAGSGSPSKPNSSHSAEDASRDEDAKPKPA
jgi:hypothetical protein